MALIVLVGLLGGLCVHYGATHDAAWPYLTGDRLAADHDGWDGETVLLFGKVMGINETTLRMRIKTDAEAVARPVTDVSTVTDRVVPGGVLQVYGELGD